MSIERIIGVDFGTSTSVIRVKRYQDGQPVGDPLETKPVTFKMGSTMVPTLIQKLPSGDAYFGYEAEILRRNTETFRNFKVDIENPDEGIRRQARELTKEYFTYLAKSYRTQSEGGHLGEIDDEEHTIISYPVKWSNETKAFMVRTAKDAGFPHVEGIDEARAAIQAVTVQNADLLTRKGYFRDGVPVNILLIDMGAGTTDLVLCRHLPGEKPKTDILSIWPQGGNALFGGREVDELLKSYICQAMPEKDADAVLRKVGLEKYKAWKEGMVSPALEKRETVDSFAALDDLLDVLESGAEYSIDRDSFETHAADYLRQFPELVRGCIRTAGLGGDDIDLVILTGGHSQWYFVREMLSGKLDRFGETGLGKIHADPERIIPITLPQETVALGLAYRPAPIVAEGTAGWDNPSRENVFPLKYDPYSRIRPVIAAGPNHMVALDRNEPIIAAGDNYYGQCNVSNWWDIVAIAAGLSHTVGLKKDGTVIAVGNNKEGQCNVSNWWDIMAITAGIFHTVGLKIDGTVIAVGNNKHGQCNVGDWRDIVAITAGPGYTVGLKKDGTAIATESKLNVSDWQDIVAIAAGQSHTIGLKKDGTVIAVGNNRYGQCNVSSWRDVVAIAAGHTVGYDHTVGLRKDGTVIAVGNNDYGQCNVGSWRDVVAIAAGYKYTVGLEKDGTIVIVGNGQTSLANMKFKSE